MSLPTVKWITGAPKQLKVGMVLKSGAEVNLIGSHDVHRAIESGPEHMLSGAPIEAHGQLVDAYVLEWLGNDGIVKGGVEMSSDLWKSAPEGATHYYIGSINPWRDLSAEDWNWWQDGKWHSPHDEQYAGLTESVDTSSAGLIRRSGAYLMARPNPSDMKP